MRTTHVLVTCLLPATLIAGCGADFNARRIVEPDTARGKLVQDLAGPPEGLVKAGRISAHRRCETTDGTEIDVWIINPPDPPADQPATPRLGTVLVLHGLGESKASFPYSGVGRRLAKMGYDVVLPDLRAHGRSSGKYVTHGVKEKNDVKFVVDSLLRDGLIHEPIYAFGTTLGAVTAIQYAALDPRCKGVFAMTPYRDARTIARRQLMLISEKDFDSALARAGELAEFDPEEASSLKAAEKLQVPLLLAHAMFDPAIPADNSKAIRAAASGPTKLILINPAEQLATFAVLEDWIAEKMDMLVKTELKEEGDD